MSDERAPQRALIVAGGQLPTLSTLERAGHAELVIAADSGLDHARALGVTPDVAIGDFDSVSKEGRAWAADNGIPTECHPADKDATDLELALDWAIQRHPTELVVIGLAGGRTDHYLANLAVLGGFSGHRVRAEVDDATLWWVTDHLRIEPDGLANVTLLAVGDDVTSVCTQGLLYPLDNEVLSVGSSRGVSNVPTGEPIEISVAGGTLLVVATRGGNDG